MANDLSKLGLKKEDILGFECRHATYTTSPDKRHDCVTVKEYIHLKDGRRIPNIRTIVDYKRPFWVTSKAMQKNKDHLEWEKLENLTQYESTQIDLLQTIASATNQYMGPRTSLKALAQKPILYGADIRSTELIKYSYTKKFPDCISPVAAVAALDIEADIVYGTGDIICASLTFKDKAILTVNKWWLGPENYDKLHEAFEKHLGKYKRERNINLEIVFCDDEAQCAKLLIDRAHEWKPDFISIWNMNYDLKKIEEVFKKYKYDSARIFSDPDVPDAFAKWKYKEGKTQKVTQSGKTTGLHPADRWHIAECPASFYFIDAMCLYKRIRIAEGMVSSYSLDATLNRHLGIGKLNFAEVDKLNGTAWHREMQSKYRIEYCIYNLFDNIGQELLDEKTGDINKSFTALVGVSDFDKFNSNPRRIVDDLHFFCLENNLVISATPDEVKHELDRFVVGLNGWIVTLPAYLMSDSGLRLVKDNQDIRSLAHPHCADIDIEGTYPNLEDCMNISNETTYRELGTIQGLTDEERRAAGINLSGGIVNSVELCTSLLGLPNFEQMEAIYLANR